MGARAVLIAVALTGCAEAEPRFLSTEGWSSLALLEATATGRRLTAYAVREDAPVRREVSADEALWVVGYRSPLSALGWTEGALPLAASGVPLPVADSYYQWADEGWRSLPAAPPEVAELRLDAGCAQLELTRFPLELAGEEEVGFMVDLEGDAALLSTSAGRFFRVTTAGLERLTELSTRTPSRAAFRGPDGELWLLGVGGRVVHGRLGAPLEEAPRAPLGDRGLVMDGAPAGTFELFAADADLAVAHFDGAQWTRVRPPGGAAIGSVHRSGIAWAEPGIAVVIGSGASVVEVSSRGSVRTIPVELTPRGAADVPWSVRYIEGRGAMVGSHFDVLLARDGGAYRKLPEPPITPRADVMVDLGARTVLAGGQNGNFVELGADGAFCEPLRLRTGAFTHAAARLGRGAAWVAGDGGAMVTVTVATRRP